MSGKGKNAFLKLPASFFCFCTAEFVQFALISIYIREQRKRDKKGCFDILTPRHQKPRRQKTVSRFLSETTSSRGQTYNSREQRRVLDLSRHSFHTRTHIYARFSSPLYTYCVCPYDLGRKAGRVS